MVSLRSFVDIVAASTRRDAVTRHRALARAPVPVGLHSPRARRCAARGVGCRLGVVGPLVPREDTVRPARVASSDCDRGRTRPSRGSRSARRRAERRRESFRARDSRPDSCSSQHAGGRPLRGSPSTCPPWVSMLRIASLDSTPLSLSARGCCPRATLKENECRSGR